MIGIDTNILLRVFFMDGPLSDQESEQSQLARNLVLQSEEQPFFVNHVVIAETVWVLRQRLKLEKADIIAVLGRLLHMSNVVVQDSATVAVALETYIDQPADFSDHLIGALNRRNGCSTTYTFDKAASRSSHFSELTR